MSFAARVDARGWAQVLLWVVPLLWSSNYVIARAADGVIAPHALAAGRWLVAGALLLPFVWRPLLAQRALCKPFVNISLEEEEDDKVGKQPKVDDDEAHLVGLHERARGVARPRRPH
jgi:hypothetical protein